MKLLKKNEVAVAKSKEKKLEIDQGVQLAKRVDALRQTAAEEEAALVAFRTTAVREIYREIDKAVTERDTLLAEIKDLRAEKEVGMTHVRLKEKEADERMKEVMRKEYEANQRHFQLDEREKELDTKQKKLEKDREEVTQMRRRAVNYTDRKYEELEEARKEREQATRERNSVQALVESEGKKLLTLERDIKQREEAVADKFLELEVRAERIENKEKAINDRYAALLQTEKHLAVDKAVE